MLGLRIVDLHFFFDAPSCSVKLHMKSDCILFQMQQAFPRFSFIAGPLTDKLREVSLSPGALISAGLPL
jgi:hypothetical protein